MKLGALEVRQIVKKLYNDNINAHETLKFVSLHDRQGTEILDRVKQMLGSSRCLR